MHTALIKVICEVTVEIDTHEVKTDTDGSSQPNHQAWPMRSLKVTLSLSLSLTHSFLYSVTLAHSPFKDFTKRSFPNLLLLSEEHIWVHF